MKKPLLWIIVAAVVSAALLRDPFVGPIIGFATGLIIGLPAYYILSGILELYIKYKGTLPSTIAAYVSILLIIVLQWFMFHPSAKSLFSHKLASPIPGSVNNLKSKTRFVGPDIDRYLCFNINKEDVDKIIQNKGFVPAQYKFTNIKDDRVLELSSPNNSFSFSISGDYCLSNEIKEIRHPEFFIRDNIHNGSGTYEYIIYDPNQKKAFYEFSTF